jgi:hypothetical protein
MITTSQATRSLGCISGSWRIWSLSDGYVDLPGFERTGSRSVLSTVNARARSGGVACNVAGSATFRWTRCRSFRNLLLSPGGAGRSRTLRFTLCQDPRERIHAGDGRATVAPCRHCTRDSRGADDRVGRTGHRVGKTQHARHPPAAAGHCGHTARQTVRNPAIHGRRPASHHPRLQARRDDGAERRLDRAKQGSHQRPGATAG